MALTGKDVQEAVFTTSRKGYSKDEVDDFLDKVVQSLEEYRERLSHYEGPGATGTPVPVPATPGLGETTQPAEQSAEAVSSPSAATPVGTAAPGPAAGTPGAPQSAVAGPGPSAVAPEAEPSQADAAAAGAGGEHQAGWYPDPWQQATERYYDGQEWTAQTR